ncbi:MAG: hypothetical protein WC661_18515 [Opitutaceae bacterium]
MKTLAKSKKPARKSAARRVASPLARLTPPPGKPAREVMAHYPAPSPDFDAAAVERIVASRSER